MNSYALFSTPGRQRRRKETIQKQGTQMLVAVPPEAEEKLLPETIPQANNPRLLRRRSDGHKSKARL